MKDQGILDFRHVARFLYSRWKSSIKAKALPSIPSTMAPGNIVTQADEVSIDLGEPHPGVRESSNTGDRLGKLSHEIFKYDCLDRRLKRHHVTGNCPLDYPKNCSLILDRNCFLRCRWHWSVSNLRIGHSPFRSRRCFARVPVRRSYDLHGHEISGRDGQRKTSLWGDHGLPWSICRRKSRICSGFDVLVRAPKLISPP